MYTWMKLINESKIAIVLSNFVNVVFPIVTISDGLVSAFFSEEL